MPTQDSQVVYQILADTRQYRREMDVATRHGAQLERQNEELERVGVKTTAQFRRELKQLERLTAEYEDDELAVQQLTQRKKALVAQMRRVENQAGDTEGKMGGLGQTAGTLRAGLAALAGSGAVAFLVDLGRAGIEAQQALALLNSSVTAARREFGDAVGDQEDWIRITEELGNQFTFLSETAIAGATARTIDMTKRLGLNATQMQVLLQRTAALSIGKAGLEESVERTAAALRGEAESAEFLGLTLNQDFVKAQALARGFDEDLLPALDNVGMAQLRYLELLQQSNAVMENTDQLQQNQAARLSALSARWADVRAELGENVLLITETSGALDFLEGNLDRLIPKLAKFFLTLGQPVLLAGLEEIQRRLGITFGDDSQQQVDDLGRAFIQFQRDVASVSEEVADDLSEGMFRAAAQAGQLADLRTNVFDRASAALIARLEEEARQRRENNQQAETLIEQQVQKVQQLETQLGQLSGPELARLVQLEDQAEEMRIQVRLAKDLFRFRQREAQLERTAQRFGGTTTPDALPGRAPDRLPTPGRTGVLSTQNMEEQLNQLPDRYQQMADELVPISEQIAEALTDPFDRAGISVQTWVTQTTEGATYAAGVLAESLRGFEQLAGAVYDAAGEKAKGWFQLSKGIAIAAAIADTYAAANKALAAAPPPFNYALMAGVIASGIANVVKIASTQPGSTAGGSSGGSSAPRASTQGTSAVRTRGVPAGIDRSNINLGRDAGMKQVAEAVRESNSEVVGAIEGIDARTELRDDHILVSFGRARGRESDVGV